MTEGTRGLLGVGAVQAERSELVRHFKGNACGRPRLLVGGAVTERCRTDHSGAEDGRQQGEFESL